LVTAAWVASADKKTNDPAKADKPTLKFLWFLVTAKALSQENVLFPE